MSVGKATTCKDALRRWEEETGQEASSATEVTLSFQWPPIEKMDNSLSTLSKCEKISLSTNMIEKIAAQHACVIYPFLNGWTDRDEIWHVYVLFHGEGVSSLKNLRILSLGRNFIKGFTGLEALGDTLEELWVSYNCIEKMKGINAMRNLRVLYMSNNLVREWNELSRLAELQNLRDLLFVGNPLCEGVETEPWRLDVARRLPNLEKLDGEPIIRTDDQTVQPVKSEAQQNGKSVEEANVA